MRSITLERLQIWLIGICALWLLSGQPAFGQQALRPLPSVLRSLTDEVGAISSEDAGKLNAVIEEIKLQTGVQVVTIIVATTAPETVRDYLERLAQRWEHERSIELDRSIFIVVSVNDREMQVVPGNKLAFLDQEFTRPGAYDDLVPLFRDGRYFEALLRVNRRILEVLVSRGQAARTSHHSEHLQPNSLVPI